MFSKEDLIKLNGFRSIVSEGDFEIKGKAVLATSPYFHWFFNELEGRIRAAIISEPSIAPLPIGKKK